MGSRWQLSRIDYDTAGLQGYECFDDEVSHPAVAESTLNPLLPASKEINRTPPPTKNESDKSEIKESEEAKGGGGTHSVKRALVEN